MRFTSTGPAGSTPRLFLQWAVMVIVWLSAMGEALPSDAVRSRRADKRQAAGTHWVDTWTSMPQLVEQSNLPPAPFLASNSVFNAATLRQTMHLSIGASTIRIQFSNTFGGSDLTITAASFAKPTGGQAGVGTIDTSTLQNVTFGGKASITIPKGAVAYSDNITATIAPQSVITITMYLASGQSGTSITGHPGSRTTSFMQSGNHVNDASVSGASVAHWYFVTDVEAIAPTATNAFVILGDSITDGRGSTDNADNRWPDLVLAKLQAAGRTDVAVDNEAAGGNAVLSGGLGPYLLSRYKRDAVQQQGVKWVMIFEGVNDIGSANRDISSDLIAAFTQIAADCHAAGLKVFGATITPLGTSYYTAARETTRQEVNKWILNSNGTYDAVVNFDALLRDPNTPTQLASQYNSGDGLHPNVAGYQHLADNFPLTIFT